MDTEMPEQAPHTDPPDHTDDVLRIGYAGGLLSYVPGSEKRSLWSRIKDWFWTYRIHSVQHHTRSGYFLIRGLERFKQKYPAYATRLQVELWGMIDPGNKAQAEQYGVADILTIGGYHAKQESNRKIRACDLLFLPLETGDDPLYIPGKIFDYIKQRKPVFILGHRSDCTDILQRAGVGILVDPFDPEAIADCLKSLVDKKALLPAEYQVDVAYVENTFHFRVLAREMAAVFEAATMD